QPAPALCSATLWSGQRNQYAWELCCPPQLNRGSNIKGRGLFLWVIKSEFKSDYIWLCVYSKFTNMMMKGGNKVLARSLMSQTLEAIKRKQLEKYHKAPEDEKETIECNPYVIFHQALKNCQPIIGLSNITKGGKTYQVPVPLKDSRKRFLAMKWLITECRENKSRRMLMPEKLSLELLQAFNNEGPIIKKKHTLHKMAEANRAYAHFRW
uniref:Small ribosomal subunit protein uS7m n=1 Tax=Athene cunicularia TaxID=194338 RepID=A0A663LS75_ATHCN